jgi:uncharacterized protein (TIGR00730 family)
MRIARDLGYRIALAGIGIVYGGGQIGLMGALIEGSLAGGGDIVGVIPEFLLAKERTHDDARTEIYVVSSMHERKATYYKLAGAYLVLPGGVGTFEEFFETLAWVHLGLVRGPIVLFNEASYFDALIALLDRGVAAAFVSQRQRDLVQVVYSIDEALAILRDATVFNAG